MRDINNPTPSEVTRFTLSKSKSVIYMLNRMFSESHIMFKTFIRRENRWSLPTFYRFQKKTIDESSIKDNLEAITQAREVIANMRAFVDEIERRLIILKNTERANSSTRI